MRDTSVCHAFQAVAKHKENGFIKKLKPPPRSLAESRFLVKLDSIAWLRVPWPVVGSMSRYFLKPTKTFLWKDSEKFQKFPVSSELHRGEGWRETFSRRIGSLSKHSLWLIIFAQEYRIANGCNFHLPPGLTVKAATIMDNEKHHTKRHNPNEHNTVLLHVDFKLSLWRVDFSTRNEIRPTCGGARVQKHKRGYYVSLNTYCFNRPF